MLPSTVNFGYRQMAARNAAQTQLDNHPIEPQALEVNIWHVIIPTVHSSSGIMFLKTFLKQIKVSLEDGKINW